MVCLFKDIIEEDVEQKRKASLKRMASADAVEEVHDEENDGYDYEDDDFEVRVKWYHFRYRMVGQGVGHAVWQITNFTHWITSCMYVHVQIS